MSGTHAVVVGGGLSGLSAAHTLLQAGCRVTLVEKNMFMGGNSTKATSGMNGAGTRTQQAMSVPDSREIFEEDTIRSATGVKTGPCPPSYELGRVLTHNSAAAVHWIQDSFGLALDTVSRLGGHSQPRTHRSKNGTTFPGMEITYKLMTAFEQLTNTAPDKAALIAKAPVKKLLTEGNRVVGVEYEKDGQRHQLKANAVIIATGGYGAGVLSRGGLLEQLRPDLMHLPTTNGEHCTGDGIVMAREIGAGTIDLEHVQVHPTGLVHLDDPDNRVKFLAAEALRGEGGIILDREGKRFCNDLGTRDYVTGCMWEHNKGPYRLILNSAASAGIAWHCKHYVGRRVMKTATGAELAKDLGISTQQLQQTFDDFNGYAKNGNDPWGLKFFKSAPYSVDDTFHVAVITPVVHYTMGGLSISGRAEVLNSQSQEPIPGLFAAGEVTGGVHGKNRLGGSALLECVVYGREAGKSAFEYLSSGGATTGAQGNLLTVTIPQANGQPIVVTVSGGVASAGTAPVRASTPSSGLSRLANHDSKPTTDGTTSGVAGKKAPEAAAPAQLPEYTLADVAKHNKDTDCWVVVNGNVVDTTTFLSDHPGGKMAIMAFAGRDATEEFNMVHEAGVLEKFAGKLIVGKLKPSAKL
jgi:flavocytochrome c